MVMRRKFEKLCSPACHLVGLSCNMKRACAVQYGAQAAAAQQQNTEVHVSSSVYVKNLPQDADKLYLYEKFAPYGGISSVKVRATSQGHCQVMCTGKECCITGMIHLWQLLPLLCHCTGRMTVKTACPPGPCREVSQCHIC